MIILTFASCTKLKRVTITQGNLISPQINLKDLTILNLNYCSRLQNIRFIEPTGSNLVELNLNATDVNDENLKKIISILPKLKVLMLQSCQQLIEPIIKSETLEEIDMSYCSQLTKPTIECPNCRQLYLRETKISDSALSENILKNVRNSIEKMLLSGCNQLKDPVVSECPKLQELYLGFCDAISKPTITNNPELKYIDLRLSKVEKEHIQKCISSCKLLETVLIGKEVDTNLIEILKNAK